MPVPSVSGERAPDPGTPAFPCATIVTATPAVTVALVFTPATAVFCTSLGRPALPWRVRAIHLLHVPSELVDVRWRRVVVVVPGLGVVLVEVEVDEHAVTETSASAAAVTTGRESEPFDLGDGTGVGRPSPKRHVPCVLFAERSRLDVVEGATSADEEGGDGVVPAVQRDAFQAETDMMELVFVVCMSLEPPLTHEDAVAIATKITTRHASAQWC